MQMHLGEDIFCEILRKVRREGLGGCFSIQTTIVPKPELRAFTFSQCSQFQSSQILQKSLTCIVVLHRS